MLTPDVWDSARFTSIFLALSFSYISNIVHARPHAGNANRWVAKERKNNMSKITHRISKIGYYQLIFNSVLISLTIYLTWQYASVWFGNNILHYIEQQVYGLSEKPFVYRQFVPITAQVFIKLFGIRADTAVIIVIFFSAIGFVYSYRYLYIAFWKKTFFTDFTTILCLEVFFLLIVKDKKIYDVATAFLITLALGFLAHKKISSFFLIYPIVCVNRETAFILTLFFALFYFNRLNGKTYLWGLIYQSIVYITTRLFLIFLFTDNLGIPIYYRPTENLHLYTANPFATTISILCTLTIFYFVLYRWNSKPLFLRIVFLVFFPVLLFLYIFFGVSFEFRVFIEVYPIIFLLSIPLLVEVLKIKPNPLTATN
jgi:hypothetical protein